MKPVGWVLLFLGLCSTALGMYWWNKGACLVNGATLAVMNNLHVPVGLLINLLIWGQNEDLGKLFSGALVIVVGVLFRWGVLTAITQTAAWSVIFFFASAGKRAA